MDQWEPPEGFFQSVPGAQRPAGAFPCPPSEDALPGSGPNPSQKPESEAKDNIAARKVQKADREKLRRDRLNEQFLELGSALGYGSKKSSLWRALEQILPDDPERPKNDKATILTDTIQMLNDLTTQVNKLKAEYASLSDESRELTQEKNELREEKAALKSDIDSLSVQYQQRVRALYPWSTMEPSVVMGPPPTYPFPVPLPIHSGPIPVHPTLQPYQFFPPQNAGGVPGPCPPFIPYSSPCNPRVDQQPAQRGQSHIQPSSNNTSQASCLQDTRTISDNQSAEKGDDFSNVATELELKMPGSTLPPRAESAHGQDTSYKEKKEQQWPLKRKGSHVVDASSSSKSSSSFSLQDSSSNSVGDGSVAEN